MTSQTMQVHIGSIDWMLPGYFCCHDMKIETLYIPEPIIIQKGEIHFSLFQYLFDKKSQHNTSCVADIIYNNELISFYADVKVANQTTLIPNCLISGQTWNIHIQGSMVKESFPELTLQISCDNTPLNKDISITGWGSLDWKKNQIQGSFYSNQLIVYGSTFSTACINTSLEASAGTWGGALSVLADSISLETECTYCPDTAALEITNVQLQGPQTDLQGAFSLSPTGLIDGYIDCTIDQLEEYSKYLPLEGRGSLHAFLDFTHYLEKQNTYITLDVENLHLKHSLCQKFFMEIDLQDLFGLRKGSLQAHLEGLKTPTINLRQSTVDLQISSSEPAPFRFSVEGSWHAPLNLTAGGVWEYTQSRGALLQLQNLQGAILNTDLFLQEVALIEWSPDIIKISNCFCHVGSGSISAHCVHATQTSICKVSATSMPTEFLNLLFPYLNLSGCWNLNSNLVAKDEKLEGMVSFFMNKKISDGYFHKKEKSWGHLQMNFENNMLQIHGSLSPEKEDYFQVFASAPFSYNHHTQAFFIDTQKAFSARIIASGEIEKLLAHIYLGEHHVQGKLDANLFFSHTLANPFIQGDLQIKEGIYKNDYLGLDIFDIEAVAHAEEDWLSIKSFRGTDRLSGHIDGWGGWRLNYENNFPYKIYCNLNHMRIITSDLAKGSLNGSVLLQGTLEHPHLSGNVSFIDSTFHLLEPREDLLPQLPITFINMPNIPPPQIQDPSPLLADVRISVEKNTFLEGRGLSSEVSGSIHLIQGPKALVADGELELVGGSYTAFGKMFSLTSGKITLRGPSIYLAVEGVCALPELSAQVRLVGPIAAPAITFTSNPQVPLPELFSYILFNKNPSEITALQSLQIAETLLSIQGSPPPLLAKIRKTLSVDRLALSSMHNDPTKVAVEVGKYVIPGVLLTWSQGMHAHNLSVEVGLRKGFSAQAEINEAQQKKYSVRWNHHY